MSVFVWLMIVIGIVAGIELLHRLFGLRRKRSPASLALNHAVHENIRSSVRVTNALDELSTALERTNRRSDKP